MERSPDDELGLWIRRVVTGDVGAFDLLYRRVAPVMLARVRRLVGAAQAEEVVSEVFLQVWRTAAQYDSSRGTAMAWMAYFKDRTQPEIAQLTNMPLGTVKTLTFRAQRKMRALFQA